MNLLTKGSSRFLIAIALIALLLTTMPFGMTAPEQYAWFYYGGGLELMEKAYSKHKVLSFAGGNTGNQIKKILLYLKIQ